MPEAGWVKFDPTPRGEFQPASITAGFDPEAYLPEGSGQTPLPGFIDPTLNQGDSVSIEDLPPAELTGGGTRDWLFVVPAIAALLSVVPLAKWVRRRRRLKRVRAGDVTAIWEEIVDRLSDLREPVPASKTPIEFASETDDALLPLALDYSAAIYGGRAANATETDLLTVEHWLTKRYDTGRRVRAALSPKSFMDDRGV